MTETDKKLLEDHQKLYMLERRLIGRLISLKP